jgi:hypothetical protein
MVDTPNKQLFEMVAETARDPVVVPACDASGRQSSAPAAAKTSARSDNEENLFKTDTFLETVKSSSAPV